MTRRRRGALFVFTRFGILIDLVKFANIAPVVSL